MKLLIFQQLQKQPIAELLSLENRYVCWPSCSPRKAKPLSLHKSLAGNRTHCLFEIGARIRADKIFMQLSAGLKLRPVSIKINQGNL